MTRSLSLVCLIAVLAAPASAQVTGTGGSPVPLVVESSVYRTPAGSPTWAAGSNALATPLP